MHTDTLPALGLDVAGRGGVFDEAELAAVAFLARYSGRTLEAYRHDLRSFFTWAAVSTRGARCDTSTRRAVSPSHGTARPRRVDDRSAAVDRLRLLPVCEDHRCRHRPRYLRTSRSGASRSDATVWCSRSNTAPNARSLTTAWYTSRRSGRSPASRPPPPGAPAIPSATREGGAITADEVEASAATR